MRVLNLCWLILILPGNISPLEILMTYRYLLHIWGIPIYIGYQIRIFILWKYISLVRGKVISLST